MTEQLSVSFIVKDPKKYREKPLQKALKEMEKAIGGRPTSRPPLPRGITAEYLPNNIRHVWMFDMDPKSPTFNEEIHRLDTLVETVGRNKSEGEM